MQSLIVSYPEMKRSFTFIMVAVITLLLQGCFGSGGSSAPPPNNVVVAAKDSRVVVTWDMAPGVEYWIFRAVGSGITPTTCSSMPSCSTTLKVTSPLTVSGLLFNGTTYSFTINGRINGGPGGAGSPAIQATPRLAGATWSTGTALGATTILHGVAYGGVFVAAGTTGTSSALFSSADGKTWSTLTNPTTATNFNAVTYDSLNANYLSAGQNGTVIALTPASSSLGTTQTIGTTTNELFAITNNGAGFIVATGASGTIITRNASGTWTLPAATIITPTIATSITLNGVAYGNSTFVAVGTAGTVLRSPDGINWTSATSGTNNLMGVTYGLEAGVFVAVGVSGTVLTSPDGITWTPKLTATTTIPGTTQLNSVTYSAGRRFVAVANDGSIYYSEYASAGAAWTQAVLPSGTLNAVTTGGLYDYSAVGAAGLNLYAD